MIDQILEKPYHVINILPEQVMKDCAGLIDESRILRKKGIEVYAVVCKVGSFMKTDLGLSEEETAKAGPVMCYPIMQAEVLNREKTEPNIVMGLCVGHDSLFYKYSEALVTTLIAKDRVLAHNPAGALYHATGYYNRLLNLFVVCEGVFVQHGFCIFKTYRNSNIKLINIQRWQRRVRRLCI